MNNDANIFVLGMFAGAFILSIILVIFDKTPKQIDKIWQKNAVEHKAAHWETDSSGNSKFVWNFELEKQIEKN